MLLHVWPLSAILSHMKPLLVISSLFSGYPGLSPIPSMSGSRLWLMDLHVLFPVTTFSTQSCSRLPTHPYSLSPESLSWRPLHNHHQWGKPFSHMVLVLLLQDTQGTCEYLFSASLLQETRSRQTFCKGSESEHFTLSRSLKSLWQPLNSVIIE